MKTPLRSMTGFARVRRAFGDGELVVSVKSLNHRGLDIQLHTPASADPFEAAMRALIKQRMIRGHIEVRVTLPQNGATGKGVSLNRALLDEYLAAFREAAAAHSIDAQPDLNAALRIPGMFGDPGESDQAEAPQGAEAVILDALAAALDELNVFRAREGAEIAMELRQLNGRIADAACEMERLREGALAGFHARLTDKLTELLAGAPIDPQRLAHEAAILADRSDISEELTRLKIHSAQLTGLLDAGGEVGKKIDFLLQEMNRESNTILSKTNSAGDAGLRITELAIAAKAGIEKIREQSLNIE